jgi:hypothetical protein
VKRLASRQAVQKPAHATVACRREVFRGLTGWAQSPEDHLRLTEYPFCFRLDDGVGSATRNDRVDGRSPLDPQCSMELVHRRVQIRHDESDVKETGYECRALATLISFWQSVRFHLADADTTRSRWCCGVVAGASTSPTP